MPHTRTENLFVSARPSMIQRLRTMLVEAAARRRDRRLLGQLDAHLLRDIGLSPDEAETEATKPFWRP